MITALAARFDRFATRAFGRFDAPGAEGRAFALFLLGHVVVWTLYASLSQNNVSSYVDMFENWAWGREFQLGYHKHPPLFAWVTGAWFAVLPRADWAYFLLSATIGAVGLAGVWMAIGTFERGSRRLVAVVALEVSPIWGFLAIKFNANAILLAVWPWAIWAFLAAMRRPTLMRGALVGVTLALAMLGKYVSATLILAMLAALALPERRRLLRSPAMIAAVVVGLVVLGPHLVWLAGNDFLTIRYADDQGAASFARFVEYFVRFPLAQALYLLPVLLLVWLATGRVGFGLGRGFFAWTIASPERRSLLVLGFGPFLATVALAILTYSQLSSPWGFPLWSLVGALLVTAPALATVEIRAARPLAAIALFWAGLIVAAPIVDYASMLAGARVAVAPGRELAAAATREWRAATGRPLAIVAGSGWWAGAVTFHAADRPSQFIDFDPRHAPWITPERLDRDGALAVCETADRTCLEAARAALGPDLLERDVAVSAARWGRTPVPSTFRLLMRSPRTGG